MSTDLVKVFKALADNNRIRILGLLAQRPYSGEELAVVLSLTPSTVSHHLSRLSAVGLVSARAEGYYNVYQLEEAALQQLRLLFSQLELEEAVSHLDGDAFDRKVIADFSRPDGSLKSIPAQRRKMEAVLRHVVRAFQPGRRYSEKSLNAILKRYHEDTAFLRRELVAAGLMSRQGGGGDYWRIEG
jgi:biotin operon repressor